MGREAQVVCTIGHHTEAVKALLESQELILRGPTLRRRFARAALQQLQVKADTLTFVVADETVALALGVAQAATWRDAIQAPPRSLAAKLGVSAAAPAAVFGPVADDTELARALQGATTDDTRAAAMLVAVVLSPDDLARALDLHARMDCRQAWFVNAKGKAAPLGDSAIRQALRAQGYKDNKTTAVSEHFSATRYARP